MNDLDHPLAARSLWESTPAGEFRRALGIPAVTPRRVIDQQVEEIREVYRERFRRELTEAEAAHARMGAELRSMPPETRTYGTVPELVAAINAANPQARWGYSTSFGRGAGMATYADGEWSGDPEVIERIRVAEDERAAALAQQEASWAAGPAIMRTIARRS